MVSAPGVTFYDVFFLNQDTGWVAGSACTAEGCYGIIIYTVDGGSSWQVTETGEETDFYDSHFFNADTGVAVGYLGICMRTTDGGASWTRQSIDLAGTFNGLCFVNEKLGWAAGSDIWNGGEDWVKQRQDASTNNFKKIEVIDERTAWISGGEGYILQMMDDVTAVEEYQQQSELNSSLFPNPATSITSVTFTLPSECHVTLSIIDLSGRTVHVLINEERLAGKHTHTFSVEHMAKGVYLYEIKTTGHTALQRFIVQ